MRDGTDFRKTMTVAIDFDDTFTADPDAWCAVIVILQNRGHRVVCVSARRNDFENRRELAEALPKDVQVLLASCTPKRLYARSQCVEVDVWIDDLPEAIPTKEETLRYCG